jgi:hypothetical protein
MPKPKVLFSAANDSKVLYPELYGPNGSLDAKNSPESNDYLTDAIFQYMKSSEAFDVYECPWMVHMYKNSPSKREELTGFGFALRKDLTQLPNVLNVEETLQKISDQEFDYIVMDSRTVNPWWKSRGLSPFFDNTIKIINQALKHYTADKIIFFDGEDQTTVIEELVGRVTYFKRELQFHHPMVHPIGYCFPEWKFRDCSLDQKTKDMATIVPGNKSTYIFTDEDAYYEDYRTSRFAMTWKKLGWDCFRHHEILFSSCLPIFPDIKDCPPLTLTHYPKDICIEILDSGVVVPGYRKWQQYHDQYCFLDVAVDFSKMSANQYSDIMGRLKEHSLKHLTSRKMTEYILCRAESMA